MLRNPLDYSSWALFHASKMASVILETWADAPPLHKYQPHNAELKILYMEKPISFGFIRISDKSWPMENKHS